LARPEVLHFCCGVEDVGWIYAADDGANFGICLYVAALSKAQEHGGHDDEKQQSAVGQRSLHG
jgi:hypothetical protein